jgi:hypothetical protein
MTKLRELFVIDLGGYVREFSSLSIRSPGRGRAGFRDGLDAARQKR